MKTIAFFDRVLCEFGTTVFLFNLAYFNEKILNNKSIIFYEKKSEGNSKEIIDKFSKHFDVFGVEHFSEIDSIITAYNCELLFLVKFGLNDGRFSKKIKTAIQCFGNCSEPHGDIYTALTTDLKGYKNGIKTFPNMVYLPDHDRNMRQQLGIPENATVFGRHGGHSSFDIPYVQRAVYNVALNNPNIYFIFVCTLPFCDKLPNIIHLDKIIDLDKKVEFINSCDAMIWGRSYGESFGIAIAEFSIRNKPVFCCRLPPNCDNAHILLLGEKAIIYNEDTIENMLTTFNKEESKTRDWNAYRDYTPEKVMDLFNKLFIENN